ncbi:MAG TPA: 5-formyltetrahydrofolate cyclo-ligase [Sphingobium sp.]|uniref:5-formyltetrahydrofolate cyclo-ligase n=1 Tax=Sphingobium sp. TaxID=1912891 RepID=UPI002ED4C1B9
MTPADGESPTSSDALEKGVLRKLLRDRRARYLGGLSPSVRGIAFRVLPTPVLKRIGHGATISLYYATGDEAPTANIAAQLDELGYRIALPRMDPVTKAMHFAHWDMDNILVPGPFRTLQPGADAPEVAPDVIIAPLVGYDDALNRLGQGGGYYDRAFERHPDALRIGLGWTAQQIERVPVEAHDLPLHIIVTEAAILEREDDAA